uniref:Xin actin-binding repeat-containing protein 2 n=1 Tax=Aceria tosichella TaxID=561515 RepID=A0A6G1SCF8_9ACAR
MAPQKTMAISQQQQQQPQQQPQQAPRRTTQGDQAAKSKRRKGKQSSTQQQQQHLQQQSKVALVEKQQVFAKERSSSDSNDNKENLAQKTLVDQTSFEAAAKQQEEVAFKNQVRLSKESLNLTDIVKSRRTGPVVAAQTVLAKQISTEEQDDIDAGIELDGSSNSGSSVKDLNEDQIKSASVSPIMAQSNLVNENHNSTKHAVENSPIEQLAGSLCTDITLSKKIGSTTKQQLAANQQVIDADEQSLQQKLQSKQRKSSVQSNTSISKQLNCSSNSSSSSGQQNGAPQSPALCKVCEQHVYQMERMMAEKSVYHKSCFRCYQCKTQLRVDNYSSHEGQVYCKAHHRQIFQPQVKLDSEDDVDIVAKSRIRKRQMIICENEPAELPKDVVRSDTKVDDGIDRLSLNLGNIKERFERGTANNDESNSQPSSASVVIEKPSFNLKKTLMAFENKSVQQNADSDDDVSKRNERVERPKVKKLTNLSGFLERQSSGESESSMAPVKPLAVRRSESLMMRLKKYESRIAGDQVVDDDDTDDEDKNNNETGSGADNKVANGRAKDGRSNNVPKKLASIDLSSLKNQWENGDISRRRFNHVDDDDPNGGSDGKANGDNSPSTEKDEELIRIRQQLARKKSSGGSSSIKNIYENAIKEAQLQRTQASKLNSSDLSALNGYSTTEIQQQLLQNGSQSNRQSSTPSTPNKDHFQLNLSNKANKLRERFEQGLINNGSYDDSDTNDDDNEPAMSKLEQLRQEKLEDLVWLANKHEGEVQAREARNMFQQIDRRLSNGQSLPPNSRSLSSISASMQAKLQQQQQQQQVQPQTVPTRGSNVSLDKGKDSLANGSSAPSGTRINNNHLRYEQQTATERQKPARLTTSFQ